MANAFEWSSQYPEIAAVSVVLALFLAWRRVRHLKIIRRRLDTILDRLPGSKS